MPPTDPMAALAAGETVAWTVPAGWTIGELGHCRSCGDPVMWATTPAGKRAPLNQDGVSHFATCPQASTWRRKG